MKTNCGTYALSWTERPICRGMLRDVEMQDPTAFVLDYEETVQHAEGRGRNGEQVEGDDGFVVVVKKGKPFLGCVAANPSSRQIACDGSLGQHKAELRQFAVDLRCAPAGILL